MSKDLIYVPGEGPDDAEYMIVGEAPGVQEEKERRPFVGPTGFLLRYMLDRVGIPQQRVYITNVCHFRPPYNKIDKYVPKSRKHGRQPNDMVRFGLFELYRDIARIKPKIIIPTGNIALWALTGLENISKRRGSVMPVELDATRIAHVSPLFQSADELGSVLQQAMKHKLVPTYHPSAVARQYNLKPIVELDLKKSKRETGYPDIRHPKRQIYIDPDPQTAMELAERLLAVGYFSFDIETPKGQLWCIGFSCDPSWGFVLRLNEQWKWDLMRLLLSSPARKTAHNGGFDTGYLKYHYDIDVVNYDYDTMYAHKLFYPEFPQGLDFQASFYTDEPYYKDEGKDIDLSQFKDEYQYLMYNGKDACVTAEVRLQHDREMRNVAHRRSVESHMQLLPILTKMMTRGINVDMRRLAELRYESVQRMREAQTRVDEAVLQHLYQAAQSHKDEDIRKRAYELAVQLMTNLKAEKPGFNVMSGPDVQFYLYKIRSFKEKRDKHTKRPTADEKALKELYGETGDETILDIVKVRRERTLCSRYYTSKAVPHGRLAFSVNPVATKTARWSSGQTIIILAPSRKGKHKKEKTGVNAQTLPYIVRDAIVADPGYLLGYADLSQVEDRIVAYAGNVKQKIYAFENGIDAHSMTASGIFGKTLDEVKQQAKEYKAAGKEPPMRYLGKQSNHAFNYGEGPRTFMMNINKKADETGIRISYKLAQDMRKAHFKLYPEIEHEYWEWIKSQLTRTAKLKNPFGYERAFYGRLSGQGSQETYRDGYSWYPQSTAPEIINRAMIRINRELPEIEILLHMHDAILFQVPEHLAEPYKPEVLRLMDEPLYVRDHTIHIPTDMKLGERWSRLG